MWDAHSFASPGDLGTWFDLGYTGPGFDYYGRVDGLVAGPVDNVLFRWGFWSEGDIGGYYLWKSPDGSNWYLVDPMPPGLDLFDPIRDVAVDHVTGERVYVSQRDGGLFRNDFGGGDATTNRTYTLINSTLNDVELAVDPGDPLVVWAAGGPHTVEVSLDGGATTSPANGGLPAEGGGLSIVELLLGPAGAGHLQVVYSDGRVYETRNGGSTWALRFSLDVQGQAILDVSSDPASGYVFLAVEEVGVVTAHPNMPAGLPTSDVRSVLYLPVQEVLLVGTANSGLWSAGVPMAVGVPAVAAERPARLRVRPNPFTGATTIEVSVPAGGAATSLTVHDAAGRLVRRLSEGWWEQGLRRVTWNGRDGSGRPVPSGVYFVRSSVGGRVSPSKAVIRR